MKAFVNRVAMMLVAVLVSMGTWADYAQIDNVGWYYGISGGKVTVTGFESIPADKVEIPAEIGGMPVCGISSYALSGCVATEIVVPATVTSIGECAFVNCSNLSRLTFLGDMPTSVPSTEPTVYGNWEGEECTDYWMKSRTYRWSLSRTTIFGHQSGETTETVCKYEWDYDFYEPLCEPEFYEWRYSWQDFPTKIVVYRHWSVLNGSGTGSWQGANVEQMGWVTAKSGGKLYVTAFHPSPAGTLVVPASIDGEAVYGIGEWAFNGCAITDVVISNGVSVIGGSSFRSTKLKEVTIPASVTAINYDAFCCCNDLKRVNAESVDHWQSISFGNDNANPLLSGAKLYVNGELASRAITLDPAGGAVSRSSYQVPLGKPLKYLPSPTRDGFEFAGWFTAAEGGEPVDASRVVDADTALYAHWLARTATPTVYAATYFHDSTTIRMTAAEGATIYYTKDGRAPTRNSTVYSGMFDISDTTTIRAIAVQEGFADSYAVERVANKYDPESREGEYGESFDLPSWGESVSRTVNVSEPSRVSFQLSVGQDSSSDPYGYYDNSGEGYIQYEINGPDWRSDCFYFYSYMSGEQRQSFSHEFSQPGQYTITWRMYLNWGSQSGRVKSFVWCENPTYWNVYFDAKGGTNCGRKEYYKGNTYGTLPTPTREQGEDFVGWYDRYGLKVDSTTEVSSPFSTIVLSARWQNVGKALDPSGQYDVVRDPGGKWLVNGDNVDWTSNDSYAKGATCDVVTYHVFGPSVCSFACQSLRANCEVEVLADGAPVTFYNGRFDIPGEGDHAVTVRAKALAATVLSVRVGRFSASDMPESITVSFDANGGTCSVKTKTYAPGDVYGELPEPVQRGCEFLGWFDVNGTRVTSDMRVPMVPNNLKAQWRVLPDFFSVDGRLKFEMSSEIVWLAQGGSYAQCSPASGTWSEENMQLVWTTLEGRGILSTSQDNSRILVDGNAVSPTYCDGQYLYVIADPGTHALTVERGYTYGSTYSLYPFKWQPVGDTIDISLDSDGGDPSKTNVVRAIGATYGELPVPEYEFGDFVGWGRYNSWNGETFWASNNVPVSMIYTNFTAVYKVSEKTFNDDPHLRTIPNGDEWCFRHKGDWRGGSKVVRGGEWSKSFYRWASDANARKCIAAMTITALQPGILTLSDISVSSGGYSSGSVRVYVGAPDGAGGFEGPWVSLAGNNSYDYYYGGQNYYQCRDGSCYVVGGSSISGLRLFVEPEREYGIYVVVDANIFGDYGYYPPYGPYYYPDWIDVNLTVGQFGFEPWKYIRYDSGAHGKFYNKEQTYYTSVPEWYTLAEVTNSYYCFYSAPYVYVSNGWEFVDWACDDPITLFSPIVAQYAPREYSLDKLFAEKRWSVSNPDYVKGYIVSSNADDRVPQIVLTGRDAFPAGSMVTNSAELCVSNACKVSFDWKVSCERDRRGRWYDYLAFAIDGAETNRIAGEVGWTSLQYEVAGTGNHSFVWSYVKDSSGAEGQDRAWLANIVIIPKVAVSFAGVGGETGVVPDAIALYTNEVAVLPAPGTFKLAKHTFAGWSDGKKIHQPGDEYPGDAKVLSLTAVWTAKRLEAPVINAPETFEAMYADVTLTAEEGAQIRYTMDGSTPTPESALYVGPITIDRTTTFRAVAVRDDWFDSAVAEKTVTKASYAVSFDAGVHGRIVSGEAEQTVFFGDAAVPPIVAADRWYDFTGWDHCTGCVTGALNVTAQYGLHPYPIHEIYPDVDCRTSGNVFVYLDGETSEGCATALSGADAWVEFTLEGPCRITLSAKADVQPLVLAIDGESAFEILDAAWTEVVLHTVGEGTHVLRISGTGRFADAEVEFARMLTFAGVGGETGVVPDAIALYTNEVAVLPEPGTFKLARHAFAGWSDGKKIHQPGDEYPGDAKVLSLTAVWTAKRLEAPVINAPETFEADFIDVTVEAEEGSQIRYTTDGRDPTSESALYDGPITVDRTTTLKAVAMRDDWFDSEVSSVTITRGIWTFGEYLGAPELTFVTGGDMPWQRAKFEGSEGGYALCSGAIANDQTSWLQTTLSGPGTLEFGYRVSSEQYKGEPFDFMSVYVDDLEHPYLSDGGETGWRKVTIDLTGSGPHVVRWAYEKDGLDEEPCGEDRAWLEQLRWKPANRSPTVADDPGATVAGDAESGYTLRPSATKTAVEVTVPEGMAAENVTVEVGVHVRTIKSNGAKVKIVKGAYDITEFLNLPSEDANGVRDLTKVAVKPEIVKEALDVKKGAEIVLDPASPKLTTSATRPGLTYTLREGRTLQDMCSGDSMIGDGKAWTPNVTVKGGASGFFTIEVSK